MRTNTLAAGYETGTVCADYPFSDRDWHYDIDFYPQGKKYIKARFLDTEHLFEVIDVRYVIPRSDITRYTRITGCAFIHVDGRTVLAAELRKRKNHSHDASIVIADVALENSVMLMGFIVESEQEFYKKIIRGQPCV